MLVFFRWRYWLLSLFLRRLMFFMLFVWFKRRWWVSTCYCIQRLIQNLRLFWRALRCDVFSLAHPGTTWKSPFSVSNTRMLSMFVFLILRISNRSFMWDPLLRLYWIANIPDIGSLYRCRKTKSFWPKLPYGFGVDTTIFGCGRFCQSTPRNPTFGLWHKP